MLGCFLYGVENRVRQPIIKIRLERRSTAINMVSVFSPEVLHTNEDEYHLDQEEDESSKKVSFTSSIQE